MMRVALYIRVSTDEQSASAEAQEAGGRAYCAHKGFVVVEVYRDIGVSGAEWQARPGILRLEADARHPQRVWDAVVVMFQDRLGRDPHRTGLLFATLYERAARMFEWGADHEVALDTMGQLIASVRAHMARNEREMASARTRAALEHKARRGLVVGGSVYGYGRERSADGVRYTIHEGQAAVVREIYRRSGDGESARTIAHALNLHGHPSPRCDGGGTGSWSTSEVYLILRNDRYRGTVRWGRKGSKYQDGTRVEITRADADVIEVRVPELAIIDPDTWQRAQRNTTRERAAAGEVAQRSRKARYLLVGNATCGACGGPLGSGRTSRARVVIPSYLCLWHRDRGDVVCEATYSRPTDVLDGVVLDWLENEVLDEDLIAGGIEDSNREASAGDVDPRLADLEAEELELSARTRRLAQAIACGAGEVPELAALATDASRRLAAVRAEIARVKAPRVPVAVPVDLRDQVRHARRVIAWARTERVDLLRGLLSACLVGRMKVSPAGPRGRVLIEGIAAPGALLSAVADGEQGARGANTTPMGLEPMLPT